MPTVLNFNFELDRPDKTYCPGEIVKYKVTFAVDEWISSCYIKLFVTGRIKITNKNKWCHKFYKKYEKLVFTNVMNPGTHAFYRSFQLPEDLPTSLKFKHGIIEYSTGVSFFSSQIATGLTTREIFFIKYQPDSVTFPNSLNSICDIEETEFTGCFSWFKSEPLRVTTILPKTLYTLGETIPITVQINNSSDVAVKYTDVFVMEKLEFHSFKAHNDYPFHLEDLNNLRIIFHKRFDISVLPMQFKVIKAKCLTMRNHNLILTTKSSIFDCSYYVVVKVVVRGFYTGVTSQSLIVITHADDNDGLPGYDDPFEAHCSLDYVRQIQNS